MTRRRGVLFFTLVLLVAGLLVWFVWGLREPDSGRPDGITRASEESTAVTTSNLDAGSERGAELPVVPLDRSAPVTMSAASAGAATGSLLVRVRWAEDKSPAVGIGLQLAQSEIAMPIFHLLDGRTDERGEWLVNDLSPGRVIVYVDRAEGVDGSVTAGLTSEVELELPPGAWVRGEVVDCDGRAVPHASIWLSDYGNSSEGRVVMEADGAGRFELRGVGDGHWVGARAQGYTASAVHIVPREQSDLTLTLELGPPGGELRGRVIDESGEPIAGAWILVGSEYGWPAPDSAHRTEVEGPPPLRASADAEGAFSIADIPVGRVPIAARADEFGPWSGADRIEPGFTLEIEITLQAGAIVAGIVHDESGQPVSGADVQTGDYGIMEWVGTTSSTDGRYELHGLPAGTKKLSASVPGGGRDAATLTLVAGERIEWNPVLAVGLQILGRIVDTKGTAVGGLLVEGGTPEGSWHGSAEADSDGRFTISNCPVDPVSLSVHDFHTKPVTLNLAVLPGVRAGPDEVVLTVPADRDPTARFVGRFEYDDGSPAGDAQAWLGPSGSSSVDELKLDEQGGFATGPKYAGSYRVRVVQSRQVVVDIDDLQLEAGQTQDLGVIVVPKPGTLLVHVVRANDVAAEDVQVWACCAARNLTLPLEARPDACYTAALQPGEYELRVEGPTLEKRTAAFTIAAGRTVELTVAAVRGIVCAVEVDLPYVPTSNPTVLARVLDDQGVLVVESKMDVWDASQQRRAGRAIVLRPGVHRFQLVLDGEVALDEAMVVPDIGAEVAHFEWRVD